VLQTVDKLRSGNEQVLTVVGCGGNRDKAKRPLMAQVACNYSHQVILTSDNPRTEHPDAILEDMQKGIPIQAKGKTLVISNRKQAIRTACRLAQTGDIIVVAGKGHEKYQEINGVKHPFDDKEELINALAEA
jgi:UDP-N-acetylmuramoyl-L-alanyl-D-glutamate--2,6-diaminopimelate ligase